MPFARSGKCSFIPCGYSLFPGKFITISIRCKDFQRGNGRLYGSPPSDFFGGSMVIFVLHRRLPRGGGPAGSVMRQRHRAFFAGKQQERERGKSAVPNKRCCLSRGIPVK